MNKISSEKKEYVYCFEHENLFYKAFLKRDRMEDCPFWLFPGQEGDYLDFTVIVIDRITGKPDFNYYVMSRVITDSEGFNEEILHKYVEDFQKTCKYMNLRKREVAA